MTATYTFDIFSSVDGYGTHNGDWGGYWGKQGPELIAHRNAQYDAEQRMVFGATTYREFASFLAEGADIPQQLADAIDPWGHRMWQLPAYVVSSTLTEPLDRPSAVVAGTDPVEVVRRLKEESDVPLRSHASLSVNKALLDAGVVDFIQVTQFPVITPQTGTDPLFRGGRDLDLELVDSKVFDGRTVELTYRPTLHVSRG
jgi:dihydrofolate reductase